MTSSFPYWAKESVFQGSPDPYYRRNMSMFLSNSSSNAAGIGTLVSGDPEPITIMDYMAFNGTTHVVRYADHSTFHISSPYSIEFEFLSETTASGKFIVSNGEALGVSWAEWSVQTGPNSTVVFTSSSDNQSATTNLTIIKNLQTARWYRIGIMFYTDRCRIYVNGRVVSDVAMTHPYDSSNGIALGADYGRTSSRYWPGRIRNLRMGAAQWWPITNDIPADPIIAPPAPLWVTVPGYLTTVSEGEIVNFPIIVEDPYDSVDSYSIVNGMLPPGLELNPLSGYIVGTVDSILQDTNFSFSIMVTYADSYYITGTFQILAINEGSTVTWITPAGEVADIAPGQGIYDPLKAESE